MPPVIGLGERGGGGSSPSQAQHTKLEVLQVTSHSADRTRIVVKCRDQGALLVGAFARAVDHVEVRRDNITGHSGQLRGQVYAACTS